MKIYERKNTIWEMQTKGKCFTEENKETSVTTFSEAHKLWKENNENILADIFVFEDSISNFPFKVYKNMEYCNFLFVWDRYIEKNKNSYYIIIKIFSIESSNFEFNTIWSEKFGSI